MTSKTKKRPALPKYVRATTKTNGSTYHYFRWKEKNQQPALPGRPWSPEFMLAYGHHLAAATGQGPIPQATRKASKPNGQSLASFPAKKPKDSLVVAVAAYRKSNDFHNLRGSTRSVRENILKRFESHPMASASLAKMTSVHVEKFLRELTWSCPAGWCS